MTPPVVDYDDDLPAGDPLSPLRGPSVLERIKAARVEKARAEVKPIVMRPAEWSEWRITYRPAAGQAELERITRATQQGIKKDSLLPSKQLLAQTCLGLEFEGEPLTEDDGSPSTFASRALLEMFGTNRAVDVVTAIFHGGREDGPGDGDIVATANEIIARSGVNPERPWIEDDGDAPDPTRGR